jgi:molybdopterin molybdotransferase
LVLAADVVSPIDLPPWDNSAMDGYAVRSQDLRAGAAGAAGAAASAGPPVRRSVELAIVETIPAGGFPTKRIEAGTCARIFTGAPLPEGADGVIRQEDTTALAGNRVRIDDARDAGKNLRYRGEDIRNGSTVLTAGTPLGPAQLGVLASIGLARAPAHRRPVVAFMGSGDEIVDLDRADEVLAGRKIASSNTYTLLGMIRRAGAVPLNLGIARDDPADIRRRLAPVTEQRSAGPPDRQTGDLLVTTACISVGEHDHMRARLRGVGGEDRFLAHQHAARRAGRIWKPQRDSVDRAPGESGQHDGDVRAVRAAVQAHGAYVLPRAVRSRGRSAALSARLTHFLRAVVTEREAGRGSAARPQGSRILTSSQAVRSDPAAEQDDVRQRARAIGSTGRYVVTVFNDFLSVAPNVVAASGRGAAKLNVIPVIFDSQTMFRGLVLGVNSAPLGAKK